MSVIRPIQGTARRMVLVADDEPAILAIISQKARTHVGGVQLNARP